MDIRYTFNKAENRATDIPDVVVPNVPGDDYLRPFLQATLPALALRNAATDSFTAANRESTRLLAAQKGAHRQFKLRSDERTQLERRMRGIDAAKEVPSGMEAGHRSSPYDALISKLLLIASFAMLASSLYVGSTYVIEAGAWDVLVQFPILAPLFVLVIPGGLFSSVWAIYSLLRSDKTRRGFVILIAGITIAAWVGFILTLSNIYGLQAMSDNAGRRVAEGVVTEGSRMHSTIMIMQVFADVISGTLFKLMHAEFNRRALKTAVVPNAVWEGLERLHAAAVEKERLAASTRDNCDAYARLYYRQRRTYLMLCRAAFRRLQGENGWWPKVKVGFAFLLMLGTAQAAYAENWIIVLPPKAQEGSNAGVTALLEALYKKISPGDVVIAYDAADDRTIARVSMAADASSLRNAKARAINPEFSKIWDFVEANAPGEPGDVGPARFLIGLPTLLDTVPGHKANVILAGSALFRDTREPTFSMVGGYVPTDEHLRLTQERTPYGVAGRKDTLKGALVSICYTNPASDWISDNFRQHVERLWSLMTTLQGGKFGTFGALDGGCVGSVLAGNVSTRSFTLDASDDKLSMTKTTRAIARETPAEAQQAPATAQAVFSRPTCRAAATTTTGPMRIGIKWDCPSCDLDLYARSKPQSEWLYFRHRLPADGNGFFDYDWRAPPPGTDGYEYVQFNSVDIGEVAARVNFYGGHAQGGPTFRLRVWFAGCVYDAGEQRIAADLGNAGLQTSSAHWVDIDLRKVVGLAGATQ